MLVLLHRNSAWRKLSNELSHLFEQVTLDGQLFKIGERLSHLQPAGFVEIGCGMAIPSLTLVKLGNTGGKARIAKRRVAHYIILSCPACPFGERFYRHLMDSREEHAGMTVPADSKIQVS